MSEITEVRANEPRRYRWVWLVVGVVVFGVLMGERGAFESQWQRSLLAGCALGAQAFCVSQFRKGRG
jgi:hypothetical protein